MISPNAHRRTRDLITKVSFKPVEFWYGEQPPTIYGDVDNFVEYKGFQITESEGHKRSRKGKYYEGGPFFTTRVDFDVPVRPVHLKFDDLPGGYHMKYDGPIAMPGLPTTLTKAGLATPSEDSSFLDPAGAEAISIVDPTNPNAQFGVALGEILKDRKLPIPAIQAWRRRTEAAKAAGSEFLNAQFGWLPLVSDMLDTAQSVKDGNTIIENYSNASGTNVHREFEFPVSHSEESDELPGTYIANYSQAFSTNGVASERQKVTRHRKSTTRRWFSGTFTYASSQATSLGRCLGIGSDADKLFGVALTPDLVWELTPWSWAIDWFSNAGNVISNATSLGLAGLVMRYAYIMEETSIVDTYTMPETGIRGLTGTVPPATMTFTVKRRREANPFGFGLTWDGLDPTQLAITAALGITRLR